MNADANVQVWLETSSVAQTSIIIPHVQSNIPQSLTYQITTTQEGPSGRSSIGQSGKADVHANQATALSRLAIRRNVTDSCQIALLIRTADRTEHHYEFPCPDNND